MIESGPEKIQETILAVEDDSINQLAIKSLLRRRYKVEFADTAESAREKLAGKIDLILMDISLKGEENGLDLTKELKESSEHRHIPIIIVTAHAFHEDRENALKAGADDYVAKPYDNENLLEKIEINLRRVQGNGIQ